MNKKNKLKAIIRFAKWQINATLNPYPVIYPFTENARLIVQKGMTGATGNLYCGLHEFEDMSFLVHFLRKDDVFADIGANVGSYTVLASGHVGCHTVSFEPVPSTFIHLKRNIAVNQMEARVQAYNIAIGSEKGSIEFTDSFDTMNHVADKNDTNTISVAVEKLDDIFVTQSIPTLLKIDVEGFETAVLEGATKTLQRNELKAIIIELNDSGKRYGYDENNSHHTLISFGFTTFAYNPEARALNSINTFGQHNTIYIRDVDFVKQRLQTADKIKILNSLL